MKETELTETVPPRSGLVQLGQRSLLFSCVWVLALKRIGQSDSAQAAPEIALVLSLYQIKVLGERFIHCGGKHRVPVLVSLTSPDYDLVTGEVDVLLFERYSFTVSFRKIRSLPALPPFRPHTPRTYRFLNRVGWSRRRRG